jgi:hypothetical protein
VQVLPHKIETDVAVDEAQQIIFRNLIFDAEAVEQRLRALLGSNPSHAGLNEAAGSADACACVVDPTPLQVS